MRLSGVHSAGVAACAQAVPCSGGCRFDPNVQPPAHRLGQDLLRHSSGYGIFIYPWDITVTVFTGV